MYRLQDHLPLILTLVLVTLVLSPTILPARGVIAYTPGVIGGQWALYKQLYSNCMPPNPALCGSQTSSIDYGLLDVVSVYNTQVTLNLVSVYANGTGTHQGVLVDVATGYSNFTFSPGPQPVPFNFFVVAKNLVASQNLYPLSPSRFNSTISETVAGHDRMVNILRMREFHATVALTAASSSSSLTCTLSQTKLVKGGTDNSILSCTGPPESYPNPVTETSGYTTPPPTPTKNIKNPPPAKAAPS